MSFLAAIPIIIASLIRLASRISQAARRVFKPPSYTNIATARAPIPVVRPYVRSFANKAISTVVPSSSYTVVAGRPATFTIQSGVPGYVPRNINVAGATVRGKVVSVPSFTSKGLVHRTVLSPLRDILTPLKIGSTSSSGSVSSGSVSPSTSGFFKMSTPIVRIPDRPWTRRYTSPGITSGKGIVPFRFPKERKLWESSSSKSVSRSPSPGRIIESYNDPIRYVTSNMSPGRSSTSASPYSVSGFAKGVNVRNTPSRKWMTEGTVERYKDIVGKVAAGVGILGSAGAGIYGIAKTINDGISEGNKLVANTEKAQLNLKKVILAKKPEKAPIKRVYRSRKK